MASDAQIRANRANAQKSTGPRTQAGKDRSRLNSATHNLTGTLSLRSGREKEAFDAYFDRLIPDFECRSDLEYELARRAIDSLFRLARVPVLEANIYAADAAATPSPAPAPDTPDANDDETARALAQARTFMKESRTFSNLSLYEQRLSRTLQKDLDTLQRLRNPPQQKGVNPYPRPRVVRSVDENGEDTLSPVYLPPEDSAPQPGPIGFVFSKPRPEPAPPGEAA